MVKPKLVLFSAFYEPYISGAEQMVKQIAENLNHKYDLTIITGRFDKKNLAEEQKDGYKIVRVGIGHKQIDKFLYILLAGFAARKIKPDITHAIMESYAGGALVVLKKVYGKSHRILTLQSGDLDDDKKQKVWYINKFWKIIHTSPDIVTAVSSALGKRAVNLGVPRDKVFITNNGLDFSEVPEGIEKIPNRVICLGRLSWEKAHKYTLEAWPRVLEKFPDASLYFVGEGPERENIEKQIADMKIGDSVTLTGNVPHDKALEYISQSEAFICPSLAEAFGNVFVEAQACGTAPIGTRVGGIPDIIQHEENGLLIESKSSNEIASALICMLSDKELNKRLSEKGKETSKKYEWKKILEKIDSIYSDVLK